MVIIIEIFSNGDNDRAFSQVIIMKIFSHGDNNWEIFASNWYRIGWTVRERDPIWFCKKDQRSKKLINPPLVFISHQMVQIIIELNIQLKPCKCLIMEMFSYSCRYFYYSVNILVGHMKILMFWELLASCQIKEPEDSCSRSTKVDFPTEWIFYQSGFDPSCTMPLLHSLLSEIWKAVWEMWEAVLKGEKRRCSSWIFIFQDQSWGTL